MATSFADLGVPPKIVASLRARGITEPFPIQAATLPDALEGRDLCGRAPTGSGKTIAFGIPLILGVGRAAPRKPRGLVLVPTRELAAQVGRELELLAKPKGPWVETVYGGVGADRQIAALRRGVDILVACPGRLGDLIQQRWVDLGEVEVVVIDEADRMADMGFLPEVRRLLDQCPTDRQTLLFSATLDGEVDVLIRRYQQDPVRHEHTDPDEGGARADHRFWSVERGSRLQVTAAVIDRVGPTVVFSRTKHGADRIAKQLGTAGVSAVAIHGNRSQAQRDRALAQFQRGEVRALVATDVAARGIHVDGVAAVVHFDPPADHKDYVHRSGRTARAGASGIVVSLVPKELQGKVRTLQRELGYPEGFDKPDVDALAAGSHRAAPAAAPADDDARPRPARRAGTGTGTRSRTPAGAHREPRPVGRGEDAADRQPGRSGGRPGARTSTRSGGRAGGKPGTRAGAKPGGGRAGATSGSRWTSSSTRSGAKPGAKAGAKPSTRAGAKAGASAAGAGRSGRSGRASGSTTRAPLAEGQRRPSGAARRKAKREAARSW